MIQSCEVMDQRYGEMQRQIIIPSTNIYAALKMSELKLKDKCYGCGEDHACSKAECQDKSSECHKCGKIDNYARVCLIREDGRCSQAQTQHTTAIPISRSMKSITRSGSQAALSLIHILTPIPLVTVMRRDLPTQKQLTSLPL